MRQQAELHAIAECFQPSRTTSFATETAPAKIRSVPGCSHIITRNKKNPAIAVMLFT